MAANVSPYNGPETNQARALTEYKTTYIAGRCPNGDPYADLAASLSHGSDW